MRNFVRIVPALTALLSFSILYEIINRPKTFFWLSPSLLIVIVLAIFFLTGLHFKNKKLWYFFISPFLYVLGSLNFIIFLEMRWLKIGFIIVISILLGLYLENLYSFNYKPEKYQTYGMQNFSSYFNLIALFFIYTSLFGYIIFLQISVWIVLILAGIFSMLATYHTMWIAKINFEQSWLYILVTTLLIVQGFWVIAFLPTSIYVNAILLASIYYVVVGLTLNQLLGILDKSVIKRYTTVLIIIILITLLSAKWI